MDVWVSKLWLKLIALLTSGIIVVDVWANTLRFVGTQVAPSVHVLSLWTSLFQFALIK